MRHKCKDMLVSYRYRLSLGDGWERTWHELVTPLRSLHTCGQLATPYSIILVTNHEQKQARGIFWKRRRWCTLSSAIFGLIFSTLFAVAHLSHSVAKERRWSETITICARLIFFFETFRFTELILWIGTVRKSRREKEKEAAEAKKRCSSNDLPYLTYFMNWLFASERMSKRLRGLTQNFWIPSTPKEALGVGGVVDSWRLVLEKKSMLPREAREKEMSPRIESVI